MSNTKSYLYLLVITLHFHDSFLMVIMIIIAYM